MTSLRSILNPEDEGSRRDFRPVRLAVKSALPQYSSTSDDPISPLSPPSEHTPDTSRFSRDELPDLDHAPHQDCPDTLTCLPDTDGRPQHTLPVILRCAILGSPRKRLTIREIYAAMEAKYPYYKTAGPTWKQSVRHHLSLNRLFERQPRPVTDPGFGSYWTVNLLAPPGTKRPRKRGRANKDAVEAILTQKITVAPAPPEDDDMTPIDEDGHSSGVDPESEDELYDPRSPFPGPLGFVQPPLSLQNSRSPPMPAPDYPETQMQKNDRLQRENAEFRAEIARLTATLRRTEANLEDESRKKRQALKHADEEARMRVLAEDQLRSIQARWSPRTPTPSPSPSPSPHSR